MAPIGQRTALESLRFLKETALRQKTKRMEALERMLKMPIGTWLEDRDCVEVLRRLEFRPEEIERMIQTLKSSGSSHFLQLFLFLLTGQGEQDEESRLTTAQEDELWHLVECFKRREEVRQK